MKASFYPYEEKDYQQVCDFLIELNKQKTHINWNWARWEWMYSHPYFDRSKKDTIGIWKADGVIVGAAIYDLFYGEAFCGMLEDYKALLPEILEYARKTLGNKQGLGIAVNDEDNETRELLLKLHYHKSEQREPILRISLEQELTYILPDGFLIREIHFPEDDPAYQTVIWKGFDHEGNAAELEKMLKNDGPLPRHRCPSLCLAVTDAMGEFAAHCTCWYDERTDYAYVEPVCTIPKYRGNGLGKAVVLETLKHCAALGAKAAFVISDQEFYKKIGFEEYSNFSFYWSEVSDDPPEQI